MSDKNIQEEQGLTPDEKSVTYETNGSGVATPLSNPVQESNAVPVEHTQGDSGREPSGVGGAGVRGHNDDAGTSRGSTTTVDDNIVVSGTKKVLGVLLAATLYFFAFISAITGLWSGAVAAFGSTTATFHPIASITLAVLSFACALFFVGVVIGLFFIHKKLLK